MVKKDKKAQAIRKLSREIAVKEYRLERVYMQESVYNGGVIKGQKLG